MTNAQTIIQELLSRYLQARMLPSDTHAVVERLRERFVANPDPRLEATMLYGVSDCDDMALGLLWVIDRASADPGRTEPTPEEESTVHSAITAGLSSMGLLAAEEGGEDVPTSSHATAADPFGQPEEAPTDDTFGVASETASPPVAQPEEQPTADVFGAASEEMTSPPPADPFGEQQIERATDATVGTSGEGGGGFGGGQAEASLPAEGGTTDPQAIGASLEQFMEAVQAGSDDRAPLLSTLRSSFALIASSGGSDASLIRYAEVVGDFLGYVEQNELLDDVRVLNFVTNMQEPYAQWLGAPEDGREGVLEQAVDFLSDFRAMFE